MSPEDLDLLARTLRRREALGVLGGLGAGVVLAATRGSTGLARAAAATPEASTAAVCVLSPEVTEGPYWISNHISRRNIRDGRPGLPLALYVTVVDATTCRAIQGADVEVWHADAGGVYSGYSGSSPPSGRGGHATPNNSRRFLRGHQKADAGGRVHFDTIYPGWYRGRAPHIHMKVHVGGSVVHTGQLFFPDPTSRAVYRTAKYRSHGLQDTANSSDSIYAQAGRSKAVVHLARRSAGGYNGSITVAVKR